MLRDGGELAPPRNGEMDGLGLGAGNRWFTRMAQHTSEIRYGGCNALEENLVLRLYTVYLGDISMLHPTPGANPAHLARRCDGGPADQDAENVAKIDGFRKWHNVRVRYGMGGVTPSKKSWLHV